MKIQSFTIFIIAVVFVCAGMLPHNGYAEEGRRTMTNFSGKQKILVAYFSHSGNTRVIANEIKNITGGDIFEIKPINEYSQEYQAVVDQAKKEINAGFKPELKTTVDNIEDYDIIFVGSPNWWSTVAPPVATFLSSYDFEGKIIIPFMTHEGTRLGHSVADIKKICAKAKVMDGHAVYGHDVNNAHDDVAAWIKKIKL